MVIRALLVLLCLGLVACGKEEAPKKDVRTTPPETTNPVLEAQLDVFHWENLSIQPKEGERVDLKVQVADSDYERGLGYMFRRSIPAKTGIFFKFPRENKTGFWMKNVYLPLDVIFVDAQGKIIYIEKEAVPGNIEPFGPEQEYLGVVEIAGGQTDKLNINIGDEILHPFFNAR